MRILYKPLLVSCCLAAFFSVVYISCKKDHTTTTIINTKCKNVTCVNSGVCDTSTGNCICLAGYQGTNCETVSRAKFLGNWIVFEKGSMTPATQYAISIQSGANITDVRILNFYNYFTVPVKGIVEGDSLYIPNQQFQGKVVFGLGYIYSNATYGQFGAISMRYEIIDTATLLVNDFGFYAPDESDPSAWNK